MILNTESKINKRLEEQRALDEVRRGNINSRINKTQKKYIIDKLQDEQFKKLAGVFKEKDSAAPISKKLENNDPKKVEDSLDYFFDDDAAYFYICPNDIMPNRPAHEPELDVLLRNRKEIKPDYSDVRNEIKEIFAEIHIDICEQMYDKIKTILNKNLEKYEKTKIIMLISVLFNSAKFKYIVLPNIKDNKLLSALNFGISKSRPSQHIDWKKIRFYSDRKDGFIRLDSPFERSNEDEDDEDEDDEEGDYDDNVSSAGDRIRNVFIKHGISPLAKPDSRLITPRESISSTQGSFYGQGLTTLPLGKGLSGNLSVREFLPTKEIWQKLNLYILENKNVGNDSKLAYRDYTELLDILLKRKQINKRQYILLLRKFDRSKA